MDRILIVEDELFIAELEKDYLELSDYEVTLETDGKRAVRLALEEDFNLVVLDLMLPRVDGFEICKRIREIKNIPIIMVSAKKGDVDKIRGLSLGADDYMTKPFNPSELVARVKAHLARYRRLINAGNGDNDVLEIGNMRIDKKARRVYIGGKEKDLNNKEFDILSFLMQNPNRVLSKEELFQEIWGMDAKGDHSTITVHIKNIRKKIEKNSANPEFIETIWGVGYRYRL